MIPTIVAKAILRKMNSAVRIPTTLTASRVTLPRTTRHHWMATPRQATTAAKTRHLITTLRKTTAAAKSRRLITNLRLMVARSRPPWLGGENRVAFPTSTLEADP